MNRENVAVVALFDDKVGELSWEDVKFASAITSRGVMTFIYLRNWDRMLDRERQFTKITDVLGVRGAQVRLLDRKANQLQLA